MSAQLRRGPAGRESPGFGAARPAGSEHQPGRGAGGDSSALHGASGHGGGPQPSAPPWPRWPCPLPPLRCPPSPCRRHWCCSGHRARRLQRPRGQSCFVRGWLGISKPCARTTLPDFPPTPQRTRTPLPPRSHGSPADLPGTLFTQQPSRKKNKKKKKRKEKPQWPRQLRSLRASQGDAGWRLGLFVPPGHLQS